MTLDLSGKTALVTGGTRGIGRAIVEALAGVGARVAFTYRASADTAGALERELAGRGAEVFGMQGDAGDPAHAEAAVQAVLDRWGSLDVLILNAGVTRDNLLLRMSEEEWDAVLDTNLKSAFHFCKAAYRPMMKQRAGSIVTLASVVGVMGNAGQANYAASKGGLIAFTKSLARELAGRGVRANVVAPGYVATDMTSALGEKAQEALQAQIPLGRVGTPEEIASVVTFLASDAASYVTGQVLNVNGGMVMGG